MLRHSPAGARLGGGGGKGIDEEGQGGTHSQCAEGWVAVSQQLPTSQVQIQPSVSKLGIQLL